MKTKYKHIEFELVENKPKTGIWLYLSRSHGGALGAVKWYSPWRQYCFFPEPCSLFNVGCMEDINHFIGQLKEMKKK
jgi:hypothetical protein